MKLGFLTSEYPHPNTGNSGGIGTSIKNLASELSILGHQISIFVYGQNADEVFKDELITIYKIRNVQLKGLSWYLTRKKIERIINQEIAKQNIEFIEAPEWTGITAFLNLHCKVVLRLHGSDTFFCGIEKRPVKFKNKFLESTAFNNADAIIAVSKFVGEQSNKYFHSKRNFTVIPNGIELSKFSISNPIESATEPIILYFGTLIRKKGVFELPGIFNIVNKQFPKAKLVLVGSDSIDISTNQNSTWKLIHPLFTEEAINRVSYLGKVPYEEISNLINVASICVFPSYAEALPVSWIEAMAKGKPIVASNIGWANELIENTVSGMLELPSNHQEFASHIISILKNTALANQLSINARLKVEKEFTSTIVAQKTIQFYTDLKNHG